MELADKRNHLPTSTQANAISIAIARGQLKVFEGLSACQKSGDRALPMTEELDPRRLAVRGYVAQGMVGRRSHTAPALVPYFRNRGLATAAVRAEL